MLIDREKVPKQALHIQPCSHDIKRFRCYLSLSQKPVMRSAMKNFYSSFLGFLENLAKCTGQSRCSPCRSNSLILSRKMRAILVLVLVDFSELVSVFDEIFGRYIFRWTDHCRLESLLPMESLISLHFL